jgi:hypothetical protein
MKPSYTTRWDTIFGFGRCNPFRGSPARNAAAHFFAFQLRMIGSVHRPANAVVIL